MALVVLMSLKEVQVALPRQKDLQAKNLLLDVSKFELFSGDRVAITGPNGSGKTSLLRLMAGTYSPTRGMMIRQGEVSSFLDLSAGMSPNLTGYENLMLKFRLMGSSKAEAIQLTRESLQFAELEREAQKPLRHYSSGMKTRLAFSSLINLSADIILLDEWLSVGDVGFRTKAESALQDIIGRSKALVVATHSQKLIDSICNRVVEMEQGRIVKDSYL